MRLHVPHVRLGGRSMASPMEAVRVSTFAIWGGRSTFAFVEVCTIFHRLFTILFLFSLSREECKLASWLPSLFVCLSLFVLLGWLRRRKGHMEYLAVFALAAVVAMLYNFAQP